MPAEPARNDEPCGDAVGGLEGGIERVQGAWLVEVAERDSRSVGAYEARGVVVAGGEVGGVRDHGAPKRGGSRAEP